MNFENSISVLDNIENVLVSKKHFKGIKKDMVSLLENDNYSLPVKSLWEKNLVIKDNLFHTVEGIVLGSFVLVV